MVEGTLKCTYQSLNLAFKKMNVDISDFGFKHSVTAYLMATGPLVFLVSSHFQQYVAVQGHTRALAQYW